MRGTGSGWADVRWVRSRPDPHFVRIIFGLVLLCVLGPLILGSIFGPSLESPAWLGFSIVLLLFVLIAALAVNLATSSRIGVSTQGVIFESMGVKFRKRWDELSPPAWRTSSDGLIRFGLPSRWQAARVPGELRPVSKAQAIAILTHRSCPRWHLEPELLGLLGFEPSRDERGRFVPRRPSPR